MKRTRLLLLLLAVSLLVACSSQEERPRASKDLISLVDSVGREVTIEGPVEKLASFYPLAGQLVTMLNRDVEIVGVSQGLKKDTFLMSLNPSIERAEISGSGREINIEALMELSPDLVLITRNIWDNPKEVNKLDSSGLNYLVLDYSNIEDQMNLVDFLGRALSSEDKARAYNDYYKSRLKLVEERLASLTEEEKLSVFYSTNEATRTETMDTIVYEWIERSGLRNVANEEGLKLFENSKYFASLEQIYIWDPDIILVHSRETRDYIMEDSKWKGLDSVINERVYNLPIGVSRWGHVSSMEVPLASLWVGVNLYPEKFEDIDLEEEVRFFYREFFEEDLDQATIEKILKGEEMRMEK